MAHPDRFTISRYLKEANMPRIVSEGIDTAVIKFTFVHPPNSSCQYGGYNRDVRVMSITAANREDARTLAENSQELCDLCQTRYIPVLPQSGTIFV